MTTSKSFTTRVKSSSLLFFLLILLITSFNSCKKSDSNVVSNNLALINKAKLYFGQESSSLALKQKTLQSITPNVGKGKVNLAKAIPLWDDAVLERASTGETLVTVPMLKFKLNNNSIDYDRRFVFSEKNGNIVSAEIIEVVAASNIIQSLGIKPILGEISNFTGFIIKYDIDYKYKEGKYYKSGKIMPGNAYLSSDLPKSSNVASSKVLTVESNNGKLESTNVRAQLLNKKVASNNNEIAGFEPVLSDGESCEIVYQVYIERDESGNIVYWENLGIVGTICAQSTPEHPPGTVYRYVDCAGVEWGSAYMAKCGCVGGTTGYTGCLDFDEDSLRMKFPCVSKVMLSKLKQVPGYVSMIEPFLKVGQKPTITWNANDQPWASGSYSGGTTEWSDNSRTGMSSDIKLNSQMIRNASKLLITAVAIHETYHAYINYMFASSTVDVDLFNKSKPNYMAGLYQYILYSQTGSHNNYTDHYNMLTSQLDNFTAILYAAGEGAYSLDESRKALLFGMNNPGPNPDFGQTEFINKAYSEILKKYGYTTTEINNFHLSQINAPANLKLPTNCQ